MRTFLKFLEQDLVDVKTMTEIHYWDSLINILQGMLFEKVRARTSTKETPFNNVHVLKNHTVRRKINFENDYPKNKEEKLQTGKTKTRKKRKKLNKHNSEVEHSSKDLREEALSKILNESATVHFFNLLNNDETKRENCDIDKNNNSSSDDCSKSRSTKPTKKKSKSKTHSDLSNKTYNDCAANQSPNLPKISLKEFSRMSAEEENIINTENILNNSKQVLNNIENTKDFPSSGGCLKKSITDILNSLNNVQFYSNLNSKNTNVDSHNVTNLHKEANIFNQTRNSEQKSPTNEYLLYNNKPKSYGTISNSNPFLLASDLENLKLNDSNDKNVDNLLQSLSSPPKSNISDIILSGTDLGSSQLSKIELNRPNLSNLNLSEHILTKPCENVSNNDDNISKQTDNSDANRLTLNSSAKVVKNNVCNTDLTRIDRKISDHFIQTCIKTSSNDSIVGCEKRGNLNKDITSDGSKFGYQPSGNVSFNLNRSEIRDFNLNKSNLVKSNLNSLLIRRPDLNKPHENPFTLDDPEVINPFNVSDSNQKELDEMFEFKQQNVSNSFSEDFDFSEDHFCSKSDEETENSIKASCDNVPNILKLLSNVDKTPPNSNLENFEHNPVTYELLCTVYGIERLFNLLYKRRVRVAKPDAFIVEHIDYLVTIIKEKNKITSPKYFGNSYSLFNSELALSTLESDVGVYLVSK